MTALPARQARTLVQGYLGGLARVDIGRLATVGHHPVVIDRLLRPLDVRRGGLSEAGRRSGCGRPGIKAETVARYVELVRRVFVVDTQPA